MPIYIVFSAPKTCPPIAAVPEADEPQVTCPEEPGAISSDGVL